MIKSYTDLQQSKKLTEFLPLESADNYYSWHDERYYIVNKDCPYPYSLKEKIPCWSLAALLNIIPNYQLQTQDDGIGILCSCNGKFNIVTADNSVNACVAMIEKLHELNLL